MSEYWMIEVFKLDGKNILARQFVQVSDDPEKVFANKIAGTYSAFRRTSVRRVTEDEMQKLRNSTSGQLVHDIYTAMRLTRQLRHNLAD